MLTLASKIIRPHLSVPKPPSNKFLNSETWTLCWRTGFVTHGLPRSVKGQKAANNGLAVPVSKCRAGADCPPDSPVLGDFKLFRARTGLVGSLQMSSGYKLARQQPQAAGSLLVVPRQPQTQARHVAWHPQVVASRTPRKRPWRHGSPKCTLDRRLNASYQYLAAIPKAPDTHSRRRSAALRMSQLGIRPAQSHSYYRAKVFLY